MAYLLVILDGAADCPEVELEGKTPLEIAKTPNLDWMADHGTSCLVNVLPNNKVPQSHTGVLSLLGYDMTSKHAARGPIEALGYYSQLPKGALSARCNFSSLVNGRITDRRVCRDISQNEADTLTKHVVESVKLESNLKFQLASISTYRLSLVIYPGDREFSSQISNTDPGYTVDADYSVPQRNRTFSAAWAKSLDDKNDSHFTANMINNFTRQSHKVLSRHPLNKLRETKGKLPANFIISRDFGIGLPGFEKISEKYGPRFSSTYIYALPIELGLAKLLGMDYEKVPVNSHGNADYNRLAEVMFSEMNKYDLVVCHVKGPDEPGHDGDWKAKVDILEKIDHLLISSIRTSFDFSKDMIIITSDHATPWSIGTHTADKVPVIIAGKNISPDKVKSFSEKACLSGGMGLYYAHQIIPYIMEVERS